MLNLSIGEETKADTLLSELSTLYNLKIGIIEPGNGHYVVFAQDGIFHLYQAQEVEKTLSMLQCWDYLQNRGFPGLRILRLTSLGDLGFYMDSKIAYMVASLNGRQGELAIKADATRIAETLARLHLLSRDIPVSIQNSLGKPKPIRSSITQQREELDFFRNMAFYRLYPTAFDLLFLKIYDEVARLAHHSTHLLAKLDIERLEKEAELMGLLQGSCHGRDFRATDSGNLKLSDLKGSMWGLLAQDVGTLLSNIGDFAQGSLAIAQLALLAYEAVRPLEDVERKMIYSLGVFPTGIWDISNDYYKGKRRRGDLGALEELRREWDRVVNREQYWQRLLGDELGDEDRD